LNEQHFIFPAELNNIKITEINYHPKDQNEIKDSVFEFIELKNTGASTLYLEGIQFIEGIRYKFPSESYLKPKEFIVLASNSKYFYERYHFMPFDQYNGKLDNGGERVILLSAERDTLCAISYDDENGWPTEPDGDGKTLVPVEMNPVGNQKLPALWRVSYNIGGSPGADDIFSSGKSSSEIISVYQNYPNPFSEITTIPYHLKIGASIKITVYTLSGKPVAILENVNKSSGFYRTEWNGLDENNQRVPSGIYFYSIEAISSGSRCFLTKKMLIIRK
jgi:hypothetical protein